MAATAGAVATTASNPGSTVQDGDGDDDRPGSKRDSDNDELLTFGSAAGAADRQAIASLVTRYYAAAAAGDGARACSMLYWLVAEAIVEEHSRGKGPASLRGNTCAQVASKVFKQRHSELAQDVRALEVTQLRLRAKRGWVRLRVGPTRELLVFVHRHNGVWQMNNLLDAGAP
ncbi:MAG: hypothetical protein WA484_13320 [Solirubrobacteraceae bacterium]